MAMRIDIRGRVDNTDLPASKWLLPVFEAMVNSIHAIRQRPDRRGEIIVTVERNLSQGVLTEDAKAISPITAFVVQDNGVGFTHKNFNAFCTSDTRAKANLGGKGVGRFLWLKGFERAHIESIYTGSDGKNRKRSFDFTYSDDGVGNHTDVEAPDEPARTSVRLHSLKSEYRDQSPKTSAGITGRIIEHCMKYFVQQACPNVRLHDSATGEEIDVNARFSEVVRSVSETFAIGKHEFTINHMRIAPGLGRPVHRIHFCAHDRSVWEEGMSGTTPNLEGSLHDPENDRQFVYAGYVSGQFLDERVRPERTDFVLLSPEDLPQTDEVGRQGLLDAAVQKASEYLNPFTKSLQAEKERKVRNYVQSEAPQYRPLLKHRPAVLDRLSVNLPTDKLDIELYKLNQQYESELRREYQELLKEVGDAEDYDAHRRRYEQFLEEWNETGVATLAKYVAHRKATLSFLTTRLAKRDDGDYQYEEAIHELIFPLRATSDDVPAERMNLWIIDERLSYHHYLASDKYLDKLEPVEIESHRRTDIIIFGHPFAFAEADSPSFGSVVLIEFKRPARDDYTDDENPISQVLGYIEDLRSGKAEDRRGRPLTIPPTLPMHAFIICDITPTLVKYAGRADFLPTVDQHRYYSYHKKYAATLEVISFDTMLDLAERRNRILFDKLGVNDAALIAQCSEETAATPRP